MLYWQDHGSPNSVVHRLDSKQELAADKRSFAPSISNSANKRRHLL